MNAPTALSHLVPDVHQRAVPDELIDALKARFAANCSTALVVREQHGLCYYAQAGWVKSKGLLLVQSGVEPVLLVVQNWVHEVTQCV